MSFVNYIKREINFKIVYFGPGLSGKTTSLTWLHRHLGTPENRGEMVTLATETERSLFFDVAPSNGPTVGGFRCRFHLYTVPGPVFYDASRRLVLRGADGLVIVCDSQIERREANAGMLDELEGHLENTGSALIEMPHVLQYNKRDLPSAEPVETMRELFNSYDAPDFGSVAVRGEGVRESFRAVANAVVRRTREPS